MPNLSTAMLAVDVATFAFYALLIGLVLYLLYRLYKLLKTLGLGFFEGTKAVLSGAYDLVTQPGVTTDEMFTPHNADGSVAPVDVKPKSADPIDWLFVPQSVREDTNA